MPPTVSLALKTSRVTRDRGFTLTELVAGLLVASLLMAGLVDIIRRYARTTEDVRITTTELRADILVGALLREIERSDPGTLSVEPREIRAQLGGEPLGGQIIVSKGATTLRWSSPRGTRTISVSSGVHFARLQSGTVAIIRGEAEPPIAIATPRRVLPFDCLFDTVSRECRK